MIHTHYMWSKFTDHTIQKNKILDQITFWITILSKNIKFLLLLCYKQPTFVFCKATNFLIGAWKYNCIFQNFLFQLRSGTFATLVHWTFYFLELWEYCVLNSSQYHKYGVFLKFSNIIHSILMRNGKIGWMVKNCNY